MDGHGHNSRAVVMVVEFCQEIESGKGIFYERR